MKVLGLTGSIGMGKTTVAHAFRRAKVPVFDADAAVHALQARGGAAVRPIGAAFPGSVADGVVVREALRAAVLADPAALRRLEAIVHPLVRRMEARFLAACRRRGVRLVVLDIPLLFETGGEARVDAVVVVSAPPDVQRARVLARPGMSEEKFEQILKRQTADAVKRAKARYVIDTHLGLDHARERVAYILEDLKRREAKVWSARKDNRPS